MKALGKTIAVILIYLFFDMWIYEGKDFNDWTFIGQFLFVFSVWLIIDEKDK